MAYHKATTYVAPWGEAAQWHGEMTVRADIGSHRTLLQKLANEGVLQVGLYVVSTPLPEAKTPRVITHLFKALQGAKIEDVDPRAPSVQRVNRWPPKK